MSRDPEHPERPERPADALPEGDVEAELGVEEQQRLGELLKAGWAAAEIDPQRHRALLERALDRGLGTEAEPALEELPAEKPDAELVAALRAAVSPQPLDPARAEQILRGSLGAAPRRKPSNLVFAVFGAVSGGLALAAVLLLVLRSALPERLHGRTAAHALARSRSTAPLFSEKFRVEDSSERIERIALVRARELRNNRFAGWGVR
jgi:hypothetical protein